MTTSKLKQKSEKVFLSRSDSSVVVGKVDILYNVFQQDSDGNSGICNPLIKELKVKCPNCIHSCSDKDKPYVKIQG